MGLHCLMSPRLCNAISITAEFTKRLAVHSLGRLRYIPSRPRCIPALSRIASRRFLRCIPSRPALHPVALSRIAPRRVLCCIPSRPALHPVALSREAPEWSSEGLSDSSCVYDSKRLFFQPPELRGEGSSFPIGVQAPFPSSSPLSITETLVFKLKAPEGRRPSPPPWVFRDPPWVFSDITTWQALP